MQAYDVITQKEFLLKHGYLFWSDGREAAKITRIDTYKLHPHTILVRVTAEIKRGETISMDRSWTEDFSEVVVS